MTAAAVVARVRACGACHGRTAAKSKREHTGEGEGKKYNDKKCTEKEKKATDVEDNRTRGFAVPWSVETTAVDDHGRTGKPNGGDETTDRPSTAALRQPTRNGATGKMATRRSDGIQRLAAGRQRKRCKFKHAIRTIVATAVINSTHSSGGAERNNTGESARTYGDATLITQRLSDARRASRNMEAPRLPGPPRRPSIERK